MRVRCPCRARVRPAYATRRRAAPTLKAGRRVVGVAEGRLSFPGLTGLYFKTIGDDVRHGARGTAATTPFGLFLPSFPRWCRRYLRGARDAHRTTEKVVGRPPAQVDYARLYTGYRLIYRHGSRVRGEFNWNFGDAEPAAGRLVNLQQRFQLAHQRLFRFWS